MKIAINKAHFPVTVLGPGRRIGLWTQGCRIRCKGCVSQDTWPYDPGRETTVARVLEWCRKVTGGGARGAGIDGGSGVDNPDGTGTAGNGAFDGVTISGGEPFDQPAALANLLDALIAWREADGLDFDLLCYSGYPLARLQKKHAAILARLDALIPEPYTDGQPLSHLWRGSANQLLVPLSDRGRTRYAPYLDAAADTFGKRIQVGVEEGRVWFVGIPGRGDMAALEETCRTRGVELAKASWRQ